MKRTLQAAVYCLGIPALASQAAIALGATVSLEVAREPGVQINAPREWLQLLTKAGFSNVRIRAAEPGDKPDLEPVEGASGTSYRVIGVLTARGQMRLPGGVFTRRDSSKLRDYVERLEADGAEGVVEAKGNYGLTRKQYEQVFDDLAKPLAISSQQITTGELIDRVRPRLASRVAIDPAAIAKLRVGKPIGAELQTLTVGAGLAIALHREGLILTPNKRRGEQVELRVTTPAEGIESWPIGQRHQGPTRQLAPSLMQSIPVEIDGFTLTKTIDAISPRLKLPVLWDEAALAQHKIDPATVQVELPRSKLSYKRILEKVLFQARLSGQLRVDEAGTPFYWVTR